MLPLSIVMLVLGVDFAATHNLQWNCHRNVEEESSTGNSCLALNVPATLVFPIC